MNVSLGRRLLLALLLAIGFGIVWGVLAGWLAASVGEMLPGNRAVTESILVLPDGTPIINRSEYDGSGWSIPQRLTLDREPLANGDSGDLVYGTSLFASPQESGGTLALDWSRRIRVFQDSGSPANYWYFIHNGKQDGSAWFAGYNPQTRGIIGYIGRAGFRQTPVPAAEQFRVPGRLMTANYTPWSSNQGAIDSGQVGFYGSRQDPPRWHVFVPSLEGIELVDLRDRSVRTVPGTKGPIRSITVPTSAESKPVSLLVRTEEQLLSLDASLELLNALDLPPQLRKTYITWYPLPDAGALLAGQSFTGERAVVSLYWISPEGEITRSRDVRLETRGIGSVSLLELVGVGTAAPSPLLIALLAGVLQPLSLFGEMSYPQALVQSLSLIWPVLLAVILLALALAVLVWRRERDFGTPAVDRIGWAAFVLLLGLPGLAGYLLHRLWPVRTECPSCRRLTPQDRDHCAFCGARFPDPEPTGIEVLA